MANEVINVNENGVTNVTQKIEFTSGEKVALAAVIGGSALIGYGVGSFIIEPMVKKAVNVVKSGAKKLTKKPDIKLVKTDEVQVKPDSTIAKLEEESEEE